MRHNIICIGILLMTALSAAAQKGLSRKEAESLSVKEWAQESARLLPSAQKVWAEGVLKFGNYIMPIAYRVIGDKPADGRSLYFSLHGGGNAPAEVNRQQWENQRELYTIPEGLVIVPLAPTNTWNLWHEDHIDNLLDSLIRYGIVLEDVNPNKVYILGYSAGGDGVFQLGPRMADRWAAASMMAGHPGDANPLNLRNLPFSIYMGGKDTAYHRNTLAIAFNQQLDSLQKIDPKGFVHNFHFYADKGHWMDRKDTIAIPWMSSFKRKPFPDRVVWVEDNRVQHRSYWLSAPASAQVKGSAADVSIRGNEIYINKNTFSELSINLNDQLLDLDKPVSVTMDGKVIFRKKLKRNLATISSTVREYQDPSMIFSAKLILSRNKMRQSQL